MIGILHIEDETFITDRNNDGRIPADRVELRPTWDIDRAGSKGQVSVTADAGVLEAGMWLSTYRTITPERGEIIRFPRGHWHLSRPGISYPAGGHEMDTGAVAVQQTASGSDIVDDISGVMLTEAFVTPVGGHVISDIRALIKMATAGIIGPNLVTNGGFDTSLSGWQVPTAANGVARHSTSYGGTQESFFNINAPVNTLQQVYQEFNIPSGSQYIAVSGLNRTTFPQHITGRLYIDFKTTSGSVIDANVVENPLPENRWTRVFGVLAAPAGTERVRVYAQSRIHQQVNQSSNMFWDDIRVGTATHMPIPDSRINLPPSSATATTRIQTVGGKSIGYDAINADRLAAIGHNAIATDMDGRLTTQPARTLASATPRYTFGPGEIDLLDVVTPEISAITEKPYNHWRAVKEDFQDASASMAADSYNNNANDRFSVVNSGIVRSAPQITIQDAVSEDALQAMADAARDRYSLSETVRFAIMPVQELTVYDVVAINDPDMPEINGLWAMNSIDASGDYLVVTATRAVSREL